MYVYVFLYSRVTGEVFMWIVLFFYLNTLAVMLRPAVR